jgi:hypothetical protein
MAHHLSLITTPIELYKNDKVISRGTGFYYTSNWGGQDNHLFLVTNYHVFNSLGNGPNKGIPNEMGDSIVFYYHTDESDPSEVVGVRIPLFINHKPLWLEHTNRSVDIVVLPLPYKFPISPKLFVINKEWINPTIKLKPAEEIFIVGYPRMFFDKTNSLPIYKTGNLASEYDQDFDGNRCFIIDISAFSGNSGSPVFAVNNGLYLTENGEIQFSNERVKKFIGVYSAGYHQGEFTPIHEIELKGNTQKGFINSIDLQLGVVWKPELVQEIIDTSSITKYEELGKELIKSDQLKHTICKGFNGVI